jgi:hypothetical protein
LEQLDLLAVRLFAEGVAHRYGRIAFEHHVGRLLGNSAACRARLLSGLIAVASSKGEVEDGAAGFSPLPPEKSSTYVASPVSSMATV